MNFIPGVKLEVIEYDGQFDPAKDVPAYEWLKQHGADLMVTVETTPQLTLKPQSKEFIRRMGADGWLGVGWPQGFLFAFHPERRIGDRHMLY